MNAKLVMTLSALIMGATGIVLSFMPQEVSGYFTGTPPTVLEAVIWQVMGALYLAFAITNWTARANLIGGTYGRPIAIGNLSHFVIAALALLKAHVSQPSTVLLVAGVVYVLFAIFFAIIFMTHPLKDQS